MERQGKQSVWEARRGVTKERAVNGQKSIGESTEQMRNERGRDYIIWKSNYITTHQRHLAKWVCLCIMTVNCYEQSSTLRVINIFQRLTTVAIVRQKSKKKSISYLSGMVTGRKYLILVDPDPYDTACPDRSQDHIFKTRQIYLVIPYRSSVALAPLRGPETKQMVQTNLKIQPNESLLHIIKLYTQG